MRDVKLSADTAVHCLSLWAPGSFGVILAKFPWPAPFMRHMNHIMSNTSSCVNLIFVCLTKYKAEHARKRYVYENMYTLTVTTS